MATTSEPLIAPTVERALRYIVLAQAGGISLTSEQIDTFVRNSAPRGPRRGPGVFETMTKYGQFDFLLGPVIAPAEPVTDYMERIGWLLKDHDHVSLTELARAVIRGLDETLTVVEPRAAPAVVVLEPRDPLATIELARAASNAGAGMVVDSYVKADVIDWLVQSTNLVRVLISSRSRSMKKEVPVIATALGVIPGADRLEVRQTESDELHDRAFVHANDGAVTLVGTSINSVGQHLSTLITLPAADAASLRARLERLWTQATKIDPTPVVTSRKTFLDRPGEPELGQ